MSDRNLRESGAAKPSFFKRLLKFGIKASFVMFVLGGVTAAGIYLYITPNLPAVDGLKDIRFQVPLRIYSADGKLMGEYGAKRREPLEYEEIPEYMVNAVVGAEDDRFLSIRVWIITVCFVRCLFLLLQVGKPKVVVQLLCRSRETSF